MTEHEFSGMVYDVNTTFLFANMYLYGFNCGKLPIHYKPMYGVAEEEINKYEEIGRESQILMKFLTTNNINSTNSNRKHTSAGSNYNNIMSGRGTSIRCFVSMRKPAVIALLAVVCLLI